jgi:AraC-like DNA-binding protein
LERLIEQASRVAAKGDQGSLAAQIPRLSLLRQDAPTSFESSLYEPVLCLILRGRKQVSIAGQTLSFGVGECLLVSHELPVNSRITKAPYLSLIFELDMALLRRLYGEVAQSAASSQPERAAQTYRAEPALVDALGRYLGLAADPTESRVLGPLVSQEIHYRLLMAPFGTMLRSLASHDSNASAVARAIAHLRSDLRSPVAVPELARRVGMSASSFHKHFRAVTATTPLQYQKGLRLLEARRLLKAGATTVTGAAFELGYESLSQFSREYARQFGVAPSRDLSRS